MHRDRLRRDPCRRQWLFRRPARSAAEQRGAIDPFDNAPRGSRRDASAVIGPVAWSAGLGDPRVLAAGAPRVHVLACFRPAFSACDCPPWAISGIERPSRAESHRTPTPPYRGRSAFHGTAAARATVITPPPPSERKSAREYGSQGTAASVNGWPRADRAATGRPQGAGQRGECRTADVRPAGNRFGACSPTSSGWYRGSDGPPASARRT